MNPFRPYIILILTSIIFSLSLESKVINNSELLYLSPVPGSKYITRETNIIIKFKDILNFNLIKSENFIISGTKSGLHSYKITQTDERNTILLKPDVPFTAGEDVKIEILPGIYSSNGKLFTGYKFNFTITSNPVKINRSLKIPYSDEIKNSNFHNPVDNSVANPVFRNESLPPDFPNITVLAKDHPDPSYLFLSNLAFGPGATPYLLVLDNYGYPLLYKKMIAPCLDFKLQHNNLFTYYDLAGGTYYATNTSFSIVDSFNCGNGYSADFHELLILQNYHSYLMSYDSQHVNMSEIVPGGDTNAVVSGLIIQELDGNKNVIFQWRSWDHFQITDALGIDLTAHNIDYVHGNAIDLDDDGNVLISSRHMSEITKINRQTGNIMWRLGGKNNQFTFTNDTIGFSYQHAIRNLSNGKYILFDNGNMHNPRFSRAVEYSVDAVNKTATLIWQYRNTPDIYGNAMGNAQRLAGGNTVIGWGSANPTVIEAKPDGSKAFELTFDIGIVSYRAFKFTWDGAPLQIPATHLLGQNYPNPFNPVTSIKFGISEDGFVTIKIYDLLGREIKTLIHENMEAGRYTVSFNAVGLASGVYFYRLGINGFTETKKMMLVK